MQFLKIIVLLCLIYKSNQSVCRSDPAFNKDDITERLKSCESAVDPFECVDEFNVKPANLLMNFGYSIGFIERYGIRLNVSSSANELYQNCTKNLLDQMPDFYTLEIQKLMNAKYYDGKCFEREQLCRLNRAYLYPFICLARRQCSIYLTDAFYTLVYANQQLSLETNDQLKCSEHHDQDLRFELYNKGFVYKRGQVLSKHFCRNVHTPPRRVIHESSVDEFRITIGLEYYW